MRLGIANFILLIGLLATLPLCVLLYFSYSWQLTQLRDNAQETQERQARTLARELTWQLQAVASHAHVVEEPVDPIAQLQPLRLSPFALEAGEEVAYLFQQPPATTEAASPVRVPLRGLLALRAGDAPPYYLLDQRGASVRSRDALAPELPRAEMLAVAAIPGGWRVAVARDVQALEARASSLRRRYLLAGLLASAIGLGLVRLVAVRLRGAMDNVISDFGDEEASRPDSVIAELAEIGGALASARARFGESVSELERARHDALTGLPGRELFTRRATAQMTAARAMEDCAVALLYIDLDGFKAVNDNYGHPVGDEILRGVAATLRQCVRAPDSLGRLGGDEFVVCVSAPRRHLMDVVARAREGIAKGVAALGRGVGCSIGCATASCESSLSALIEQADAAMYAAKQARRHELACAAGTITAT